MKDGQKAIYYVTADGLSAARNSPHLEIFRKLGVEVLLLHDRIDEWVVSGLTEFEGTPLQSVVAYSVCVRVTLPLLMAGGSEGGVIDAGQMKLNRMSDGTPPVEIVAHDMPDPMLSPGVVQPASL